MDHAEVMSNELAALMHKLLNRNDNCIITEYAKYIR